ncbi:MAG TPA: YfcE family phosphodiesterase [Tepidisphaeraceae bacterium]|nr:YfcE family phosphodiesterase [Tepidisphaeraceae bacterium]
MIIGILGDTHDRVENMIAGMKMLRDGGAEFYMHCGDVGGEKVIDQLAGLPAAIVWGNNDWDRGALTQYAEKLAIAVFQTVGDIELDGKRFALTHGDDYHAVKKIFDEQQYDYLLMGHSHARLDKRMGRMRVINPGALYRTSQKSVALLDTSTDVLKFLNV